MKIIIENTEFDFELGMRLLKLKYAECPFPELCSSWDSIKPMTFREIARLENLEHRRVGVLCLGLERLAEEVKPKLLDRQTIRKSTVWVKPDGEMESKQFDDIYELYEVDGKYFNEGVKNQYQEMRSCHFVKCKDTSTDRHYFIWVDLQGVYSANFEEGFRSYSWGGIDDQKKKMVNAIQAIAWTIQTNVPKGFIKEIYRQGDCIMIRAANGQRCEPRHLSEKEYRTLLVAES